MIILSSSVLHEVYFIALQIRRAALRLRVLNQDPHRFVDDRIEESQIMETNLTSQYKLEHMPLQVEWE